MMDAIFVILMLTMTRDRRLLYPTLLVVRGYIKT